MIWKLLKKNTEAMLGIWLDAEGLRVQHDITIQLLTPARIAGLAEPSVPDPLVYVSLPPQRALKAAVDRIKAYSERLLLTATMGGEISLKSVSDMVSIASYFSDLELPLMNDQSQPLRNPAIQASATIDVRLLTKVLAAYQMLGSKVVLCMVPASVLIFHILLGEKSQHSSFLSFYIPIFTDVI